MGITIVQRSDLSQPKKDPKIALVLAGGAISGGAFKLGGLIALDSFLSNRKTTELDIYLGLSAGAFLAAPLSAGIAPGELLRSITGESRIIDQFGPGDFYYPNWRELVGKPAKLARDTAIFLPHVTVLVSGYIKRHRRQMVGLARALVREPSYTSLERLLAPLAEEVVSHTDLPHVFSYLPTGLFDNSRIERFIRRNLERNGLPNNFKLLYLQRGASLYIGATNLDTAQGVVFGHDEDNSVTISEAVQASSAIPGFFKPARINGIDYVDAGVRKTANISTAVRKGADLVIAYNPFRPFVNAVADQWSSGFKGVADHGFVSVLNQTFRMLLHSRLRLGIEKLRLDANFHGDVILIEPTEGDFKFFNMNPLAFWHRREAALHGFSSVKASLERHYPKLVRILRCYGIATDLDGLRRTAGHLGVTEPVPAAEELPVVDIDSGRGPLLRVVK